MTENKPCCELNWIHTHTPAEPKECGDCGHYPKYHQAIRFGDACTYGDCLCVKYVSITPTPPAQGEGKNSSCSDCGKVWNKNCGATIKAEKKEECEHTICLDKGECIKTPPPVLSSWEGKKSFWHPELKRLLNRWYTSADEGFGVFVDFIESLLAAREKEEEGSAEDLRLAFLKIETIRQEERTRTIEILEGMINSEEDYDGKTLEAAKEKIKSNPTED